MSLTLESANTLLINYEKELVKTMTECDLVHRDFTTRSWSGDVVEFPLNVRRSAALGPGTDGSEYRDGSQRSHLKANITRAFMDATVSLTEGIMEASDGPNASVDAVEDELNGIVESMDCYMNSIAFGDGSGQIGIVASLSTNTLTIDMDGGLFLPQLLNWPGATIEIRDTSSSDALLGTAEIDFVGAVTGSPARVGLATSGAIVVELTNTIAGVAAGDKVIWRGGDKTAFGLNPEGLDSLVDNVDETFQNIDVGQHPQYSAYVDANGGTLRDPDVAMIRRALTNVRLKTGRSAGDYLLYGNPATFAQFETDGENLLRYYTNDTTLGRAIDGVQSNQGNVKFNQINACPDTHFFGCDKAQLVRYEQRPMQFVRRGGDILFASTNRKKYFAHLTGIWQNAIMARNTSFKILDLDSSDYRRVSFS